LLLDWGLGEPPDGYPGALGGEFGFEEKSERLYYIGRKAIPFCESFWRKVFLKNGLRKIFWEILLWRKSFDD